MKKVICMVALAAMCLGTVTASTTIKAASDTGKTKTKIKKGNMKTKTKTPTSKTKIKTKDTTRRM
jgi:hypothetical protein